MFPLHHTSALNRSEGGWELLSQPTWLELCLLLLEHPLLPLHTTAEPPGPEHQVTHPTGSMGRVCPARIYYLASFISPQSFMGRGQGEHVAFGHLVSLIKMHQWIQAYSIRMHNEVEENQAFFLLSNASREVFSARQFGNPGWLFCKSPQSIKQCQDKVSTMTNKHLIKLWISFSTSWLKKNKYMWKKNVDNWEIYINPTHDMF